MTEKQQQRYPKVVISAAAWCMQCPEIGVDGDDTYCKITEKNFGEGTATPIKSYRDQKECPFLNDVTDLAIRQFVSGMCSDAITLTPSLAQHYAERSQATGKPVQALVLQDLAALHRKRVAREDSRVFRENEFERL
jgi:hypothetical protein